jgi:hypothetical protein
VPLRAIVTFDFALDVAASWIKGNAGNRLWDVNGTVAASLTTASPRGSHTHSLRLAASAQDVRAGFDTNTLTASQTRGVALFAVKMPTSLPAGDVMLAQFTSPTSLNGEFWYHQSTGKLAVKVESQSFVDGPTAAADTWYVVELSYDCSANPQTLDAVIGGTALTQSTGAGTASTIGGFNLGGRSDTPQTFTADYTDVAVWTDTAEITGFPFGAHSVKLLEADTGGSTAQIGTADATSRFINNATADATHNSADILAALTEGPPPLIGASASGLCQRTSGAGNACGVPMTTYALQAGESLTDLRVVVCGWAATTTAASIGLRSFNGTTEDILFAAADPNFDANTTTPAWLCKMAVAGRFDTQAELDALVVRLGYSTDISPLPGAHAIYAFAAVKEAAAAAAPPPRRRWLRRAA